MKYRDLIIPIVIIACVYFCMKKKNTQPMVISHTDTVYVNHTIVDTLPVIRYQYITKYQTDTLYSTDSIKVAVRVPIRQKLFTNTLHTDSDTITYKTYISGYHAALDSIRLNVRYKRSIDTHTTITAKHHFYFSHGLQAGFGIGLLSRKPDLYIGYGLTFNF